MNKHCRRLITIFCLCVCFFNWNTKAQPTNQTKHAYASTKPIREPDVFAAGVISTGDFDSHPAFMPDGKTLYFVRSTPNFNLWTILVSRFERGKWSEPEVAPFSGQYSDADPFITPDSKRLYFISSRPVTGKKMQDLDIWFVEQTEKDTWSEPKNLGAPVNSDGAEWYPTMTKDGTLYFGSDRAGGKGRTDIYRSRLVGGKYFFWTSVRSFAEKPLEERMNYRELMNKLKSPQNGLGDIYQIDLDTLKIER